ncbi:hypothetical protein ACFRMN_16505 [Streptomyces sp. NPDC056835]|uniref:aromatic-ring hydroxylase C-terminal domain-containing protein n=1 Tax=Streptomyces sp. NPDC056835 TaxID=3345956 RepID=UPI0036973B1B
MKIVSFGPAGAEQPGVLLDGERRIAPLIPLPKRLGLPGLGTNAVLGLLPQLQPIIEAALTEPGDVIEVAARRSARPRTRTHGAGGPVWADAVRRAAERFGLPVEIRRAPGPDFDVHAADFARLYRLDTDAALLIRPDGHVAWRSGSGDGGDAERAAAAVTGALSRLLGTVPA